MSAIIPYESISNKKSFPISKGMLVNELLIDNEGLPNLRINKLQQISLKENNIKSIGELLKILIQNPETEKLIYLEVLEGEKGELYALFIPDQIKIPNRGRGHYI